MKKLVIGEPKIVSQNPDAAILFEGWQDPFIRQKDGVLYVTFNSLRDCNENIGTAHQNPVFRSADLGVTWEQISDFDEYLKAGTKLPNGEYLSKVSNGGLIKNPQNMPEYPKNRHICKKWGMDYKSYRFDELKDVLGENIEKKAPFVRFKPDSNELIKEKATINWDDLPLQYFVKQDYIVPFSIVDRKVYEHKGVLWSVTFGPYILPDGSLGSNWLSVHLLKSNDLGHTWEYVNTIPYKDEYNNPNCIDIEGFNETALMFAENGDIVLVMRSGSLSPWTVGDDEHPAPKIFITRSKDGGKTFEKAKPFYDFGILPAAVQLDCGVTILSSGRPGVYLRYSEDGNLEEWSDPEFIIKVPDEDVYKSYYEYTCCNTDICVYNENTAFLVYSDFKLKDKDGRRAKSIVVRKLTVE